MSDADEIRRIGKMTLGELLDYVLDDPSLIADSYYRHIGQAVRDRHAQLKTPNKASDPIPSQEVQP